MLHFIQVKELFADSQRDLEETTNQLTETTVHLTSTRIELAHTREDLHVTKKERDEHSFLVKEHIKSEQSLFGEAGEVCAFIFSYIHLDS